jgi:hypothetical protein
VNLTTTRPQFLFHSENSVGCKSSPDIDISKSVLPDSWLEFIQINRTQTAWGEEHTVMNVAHDSKRNVDCTLELPLKDSLLLENFDGLLLFSSSVATKANGMQATKMFDTLRGTKIIKDQNDEDKMNDKCCSIQVKWILCKENCSATSQMQGECLVLLTVLGMS